MELHDRNTLGLWMSPGQRVADLHEVLGAREELSGGRFLGQHPLVFMLLYTKFPFGHSEMGSFGRAYG